MHLQDFNYPEKLLFWSLTTPFQRFLTEKEPQGIISPTSTSKIFSNVFMLIS